MIVRALVGVFGLVATVAGLVSVIGGPAAGTGGEHVAASVDTEFRFYAAFYLSLGLYSLWVARRGPVPRPALAAITGALCLGGLARIPSLVSEGRPDTVFLVLMAIELAAPLLLLLDRGERA